MHRGSGPHQYAHAYCAKTREPDLFMVLDRAVIGGSFPQ